MRRTRLEDAYNLQRLLADYKEHILFITEMKTLIETDEVAKDVAGAEMLIERHQEHKVIITKLSKKFFNRGLLYSP